MDQRITWQLTADPVPIEQAFQRAGVAAQNSTKIITQQQKEAQSEVERLTKKLQDLISIQEKGGLAGANAQQRLTSAIERTSRELSTAANNAKNLGRVMSQEITKETGLINTLSIRIQRLTTARNQSNDPAKIQRINAILAQQQERYKSLTSAIEDTGNEVEKSSKGVDIFGSAVSKIGPLIAAGFTIGSIVQVYNETKRVTAQLQSLNAQLEGITGSQKAAGQQMQFLTSISEELGLELLSASQAFTGFASAYTLSGGSISEAQKIFRSVAEASTAMGLSADQTAGALLALQQMISKGTVSAEELRGQLGERIPGAFGIAAKSIGVTEKELNKMLQSGEVVARDFLPRFADELSKTFGERAQNSAKGLSAEVNRVSNSWTELYRVIGNSGVIEGSLSIIKSGIDAIAASVALATNQWGEYQQAQINAQRLSQMTEEEKRLLSSIEARVKAFRDGGLETQEIIDELSKSLSVYNTKLYSEEAQQRIRRATNAFRGVSEEEVMATASLKNHIRVLSDYISTLSKSQEVKTTSTAKTKDQIAAEKELAKLRKEESEAELDRMLASITGQDAEFQGRLAETMFGIEQDRERAKKQDKMMSEIFSDDMSKLDTLRSIDAVDEGLYLEMKLDLYRRYGVDVRQVLADITRYNAEQQDKQKQIDIQTTEQKIANFRMYAEMTNQGVSSISSIVNSGYEYQSNSLRRAREKDLISQEEYDRQYREIRRRQAIIEKAAAVSQIAISTAVNIASPQNGVALGGLTPLYIALGATQAAAVLATPVPYAKGIKRVKGGRKGVDSVPYSHYDGSPAVLMPGEMIVPTDKVEQYAPVLDAIYDGTIPAGYINAMADMYLSNSSRTDNIAVVGAMKGVESAIRRQPDLRKVLGRIERNTRQNSYSRSYVR